MSPSLSITSGPSFAPCPAPFNLAAHVLGQARDLADKTAVSLVSGNAIQTSMTYRALERAVLGTGAGLLRTGCKPGDIILMRLGNTIDFPIAYLGALAVGLVPVPTSAALTEPEVARIICDLQPRLVLRAPGIASASGAPELGLATLQALRQLDPADWHMGDPDRLGYIIYTSGTSGIPRAVAHAHRAIWARQMMHRGWYDLRPDDVMLHAGALNWTYTLGTGLMDPWTVGATAIIPTAGTASEDFGALIKQHKTTIFAATPGVYRQMLNRSNLTPSARLRHGLSAGEKLPQAIKEAWKTATGTTIFEAYGMSECSTFISACPDAPATGGALGIAQPGRVVAILGDDGPTPRGTPGTIAIHNTDPGLMREYLGAAQETADRFDGPWFLTGDVGIMDSDGQITYLGRSDDMMNAGGYRVSPVEVEHALTEAPGVLSAGAAPVEVKPGVHVIVAFYTSTSKLDETALHAHMQSRLADYKLPRAYVCVPALPTSANGKLLRRQLPDFWTTTTKAH